MLGGDFFDKLEHVARSVRSSTQAFGGIQVHWGLLPVLCVPVLLSAWVSLPFPSLSPLFISLEVFTMLLLYRWLWRCPARSLSLFPFSGHLVRRLSPAPSRKQARPKDILLPS